MPRKVATQDVQMKAVRQRRSAAFFAGLLVVCVIVISGAVMLGKSDGGQIDVNSAIESANQVRRQTGDTSTSDVGSVPEVHRTMTNGGLVAQDGETESASVPETAAEVEGEATSSATTEEGS